MSDVNVLEMVVADLIVKATDNLGAASDFVLAELPDVVQQLLMWNMLHSIIDCVIGAALVAAAVILCMVGIKKIEGAVKPTYSGDDVRLLYGPLVIVEVIILAAAYSYTNLTWLKIWIAPKIWLIEYAAALVK